MSPEFSPEFAHHRNSHGILKMKTAKKRLERSLLLLGTIFPSPLRILLLRLLGHRVGKGVRISMFTVVCANKIEIQDDVRIGPLNIILAHEIYMGYGSEISFMVVVSGRGHFHLGQRSYVSVETFIDTEGGVTIGKYSGTGPRTMIFSHAIFLPPSKGYPRVVQETRVGDYVWLGAMNFLKAGTIIGNNVMTAPGIVVSKRVGSGVFWASAEDQVPLERLCRRMDTEKLTALVTDIIVDFAKTQGWACALGERVYQAGNYTFAIARNGQFPQGEIAAIFLIEEMEAVPDQPWYNLVTLRCSPHCTGRLHEDLKKHMRKYFGLRFLPMDQEDEPGLFK